MSVVNELQQFGLSEKEAKVYLTLLDLERSAVSDIAKKSDINRSTSYILLESLRKKKLVSSSEKNNVQYFSAMPPKKLIELANDLNERSKKLISVSKTLSDSLKKRYKGVGDRPSLKIFEGEEGIDEAILSFAGDKDLDKPFFEDKDRIVYRDNDETLIIVKKDNYAYIIDRVNLDF